MSWDPPADVDAYVQAKQIALGQSLAPRTKVYLDLNFWIATRDAALGLRTDPPALRLLELLRQGVAAGRMICPVGETVFDELLKQPLSEDRRLGTARVVDELSLGVTLIPSPRRVGTEFYQLFHRVLKRPEALWPMQQLVWTKVCHILGPSYPVMDGFDAKTMVYLQKRFLDHLWTLSLTEMLQAIGDTEPPDDYAPLTAETNRLRDLHANEITSFASAYDMELRGGIEAWGELATDVLNTVGRRAGLGQPDPTSVEERRALLNIAQNLLHLAFKTHDGAATVRTLHVEASLHAAFRTDKKRRFKLNDWHDFHHAAAALSYCDVFLTEGPLHDLVGRPQMGLLQINDCKVASTIPTAKALLEDVG